jgi:hypothetical protein
MVKLSFDVPGKTSAVGYTRDGALHHNIWKESQSFMDRISRGRQRVREKDVTSRLRRTQSEGEIPDMLRVQTQENRATQAPLTTQNRVTQTEGSDHEEIKHQYKTSNERVEERVQALQNHHRSISRIRTENRTTQTPTLETVGSSTQDRAIQTLTPEQLGQSIIKDLKIRQAEMQSLATQTEGNLDLNATSEKLAHEHRMNDSLEKFAREIQQAQERTQRSQSLPPHFRQSETRTRATQTEDVLGTLRNFIEEHRTTTLEQVRTSIEQKIRSIEKKRNIRQTILQKYDGVANREDVKNDVFNFSNIRKLIANTGVFEDVEEYREIKTNECVRERHNDVKEWVHTSIVQQRSFTNDNATSVSSAEVQQYMRRHPDEVKSLVSWKIKKETQELDNPLVFAGAKQYGKKAGYDGTFAQGKAKFREFDATEYKKEEEQLNSLFRFAQAQVGNRLRL